MASVAAVAKRSGSQPIYRPHGPDPLGTLFRRRFPAFQDAYEQRYAAICGRFRLPSIESGILILDQPTRKTPCK